MGQVYLFLYFIVGASFTELISYCHGLVEGKPFTGFQKILFFAFWPLILIVSLIAYWNQKS